MSSKEKLIDILRKELDAAPDETESANKRKRLSQNEKKRRKSREQKRYLFRRFLREYNVESATKECGVKVATFVIYYVFARVFPTNVVNRVSRREFGNLLKEFGFLNDCSVQSKHRGKYINVDHGIPLNDAIVSNAKKYIARQKGTVKKKKNGKKLYIHSAATPEETKKIKERAKDKKLAKGSKY